MKQQHVVIVGGGIAGLTAARKLLAGTNNVHVTLVEASEVLGGRIARADVSFIPNHVVDLGAEYIHGNETVLTDLIQEFNDTFWKRENVTYESFISAHADGGPYPPSGKTKDGYYGRYYMQNQLLEGNDERLQPLHDALEHLNEQEVCEEDEDEDKTQISVGHLFARHILVDSPLHEMALASYANTVGCTDLYRVSLKMLNRFESHWQELEVEGDMHMDSTIGMFGIVDVLSREMLSEPHFELNLNYVVTKIHQTEDCATIVSSTGEELTSDAVIVTVPPPLLTKLGLSLSDKKLEALQYVGFDTAVKFVTKFSQRHWPSHLQNVICSDGCIVPEMWFRDHKSIGSDDESFACHTVTCFFTSDFARNFVASITPNDGSEPSLEAGASVVMNQLSEMFSVPKVSLVETNLDSLLSDWSKHPYIQGGYMYPKVGMTQQHLCALAEPDGRIFFAGEATNTNACCTVQAAMETGVRAAEEAQECLQVADSHRS